MFGLRKKGKEERTTNERAVSGFIQIDGLGEVEVSSVPENIPSKVQIGNKMVRVDKDLYKYLWALTYATPDGRRKLSNIV